MSRILKSIETFERDTENEIAYWRERAQYWEKRYWDEKLEDIRQGEIAHVNMVKSLMEIVSTPRKADDRVDRA
jgi:hypothetical protein